MPETICNKINALSMLDQTVFWYGAFGGGFGGGPFEKQCANQNPGCASDCSHCTIPLVNAAGTHTRYPLYAIVSISGSLDFEGGEGEPDCGPCDDCFPNIRTFAAPLYRASATSAEWRLFSTPSTSPRVYSGSGSSGCDGDDITPELCEFDRAEFTFDPENPYGECVPFSSHSPNPILGVGIAGTSVLAVLTDGFVYTLDEELGDVFIDVDSPCGGGKGIVLPNSISFSSTEFDTGPSGFPCHGFLSATVTFSNWIVLPFPS